MRDLILVVPDYLKSFKSDQVPWDKIDSILYVSVTQELTGIKTILKQVCREHTIELKMVFIVPPVKQDQVTPILLRELGKMIDREVILYGDVQAM